jgi:predicted Zn-dependent protease
LSVEAFHAIVIVSSVTATMRTLVGVVGGVVSRLGPADAAGASAANTTSTTQQARLTFMFTSPRTSDFTGIRGVTASGSSCALN